MGRHTVSSSDVTAEDSRRRLLDQLDDHLLPRLRELSAPGFVVVAGSTGGGGTHGAIVTQVTIDITKSARARRICIRR